MGTVRPSLFDSAHSLMFGAVSQIGFHKISASPTAAVSVAQRHLAVDCQPTASHHLGCATLGANVKASRAILSSYPAIYDPYAINSICLRRLEAIYLGM
jgi:hypothetical protein